MDYDKATKALYQRKPGDARFNTKQCVVSREYQSVVGRKRQTDNARSGYKLLRLGTRVKADYTASSAKRARYV